MKVFHQKVHASNTCRLKQLYITDMGLSVLNPMTSPGNNSPVPIELMSGHVTC